MATSPAASAPTSAPSNVRPSLRDPDARLSLPTPIRLGIATVFSCLAGGMLGLSHGGQMAAYRFRAEHAHKLPTTQAGWFLYHKSKNYNVMHAGGIEAVKMGSRVGVWALAFFYLEDLWDDIRGKKDFLNTVAASMTVAGGFSLWNRFPVHTAARTARTGLVVGLGFGLLQDAVSCLKGRPPRYVQYVLGTESHPTAEPERERIASSS